MELNIGLNLDIPVSNLPSGALVKAKNVIREVGKGYKTHKGFSEVTINRANELGYIQTDKEVILFYHSEGLFIISRLTSNLTPKLAIPINALPFKLETTKITGTYTYNYKNDLVISFFDYVNKSKPFLLNVDDLPFAVGSNKEIIPNTGSTLEQAIELISLQPEFKTPNIEFIDVVKGGSLKCGVYQFCIAYEINDYDFTANSLISEPISIGNVEYKIKDDKIDNDSYNHTFDVRLEDNYGSVSNQSIKLKISNLDRTFKRFKLISLFNTGESNQAETIGIYNIPTNEEYSITYSGQQLYAEDYNSIVLGYSRFKSISSMSKFQSKLSLMGLEYEDDEIWVDEEQGRTYQEIANTLSLKLHVDILPLTDVSSNSPDRGLYLTNNGKKANNSLSFKPGEVYAFYIAFGKGSKVSKAYHIPGRSPKSLQFDDVTIQEDQSINQSVIDTWDATSIANNDDLKFDDSELSLSSNLKFFQIRDTSNYFNNEFGYWENEDSTRLHRMPFANKLQGQAWRISVSFDTDNEYNDSLWNDKYDTMYLLYAEKTYSESLVLGFAPYISDRSFFAHENIINEQVLKDNTNTIRIYNKELNTIKPNINVEYIRPEVILTHNPNFPTPNFTGSSAVFPVNIENPYYLTQPNSLSFLPYPPTSEYTKIKTCSSYKYLPEGDTSSDPRNVLEVKESGDALLLVNREECLVLNVDNTNRAFRDETRVYSNPNPVYTVNYKKTTLKSDFNRAIRVDKDLGNGLFGEDWKYNSLFLVSLNSYKSSVHTNINNQKLILANKIVNDPDNKYSGDNYVSHEFNRMITTYWLREPHPTIINNETIVNTISFVNVNYSKVNPCFVKDNRNIRNPQQLEYNLIFSKRNTDNHFQPSNLEFTNITKLNTRFTRSAVLQTESNDIGWRKFNLLDYFDFPLESGIATYLFGGDKTILFGFTNNVYIAEIKETLDTGGGNTLALRTNNLFDTNPVRLQDTFDRPLHINKKDHAFITKYGIVFYDNINQNIYLFDGTSQPLAISKLGINNYLKSLTVDKLVGGYDEVTDHLFFTLHTLAGGNETWSYYLTEKQIVSKYDFKLDGYFLINEKLKGFSNVGDNLKILTFNTGQYYATYISQQHNEVFIDVAFTENIQLSKIIEAIIYQCESVGLNRQIKNIIVYTKGQAATSYPFTNYVKYINGAYHYNRIKNQLYYEGSNPISNSWSLIRSFVAEYLLKVNDTVLRNVTYKLEQGSVKINNINYSSPSEPTFDDDYNIQEMGQNTIFYGVKNYYDRSNIICKFAIVRFILNEEKDYNHQIILKDILINYSKSI